MADLYQNIDNTNVPVKHAQFKLLLIGITL